MPRRMSFRVNHMNRKPKKTPRKSTRKEAKENHILRLNLKPITVKQIRALSHETGLPITVITRTKIQAFLDGKMDIPPKKGKGSFETLSTALLKPMYEAVLIEAEKRGMYPLELLREILSYPLEAGELDIIGSSMVNLPTQEEIDAAALCTCEVSTKPCPAHDITDTDEETLSDSEFYIDQAAQPAPQAPQIPTQETSQASPQNEEIIFPNGSVLQFSQADLVETLECTCEVTLDPCPVHDKEEASDEGEA